MTEQTAFAKGVGGHVQWKLRNRESSFICVYASRRMCKMYLMKSFV